MAERVTVIGAGIVGICTALSLLEKGVSVEVLDRAPPAGGSHPLRQRERFSVVGGNDRFWG